MDRNNDEPLPKRPKRDFSIDYLLNEAGRRSPKKKFPENDPEKYEKIEKAKENLKKAKLPQIGDGIDLSKHFRKLDQDEESSQKFKLIRSKTTFVMESVYDLADPSLALAQCFQTCIDQAIERAKDSNLQPNRIGFIVSSVNLNNDIDIPFSPITDNTLHTVFNRFKHVEQSKSNEASLLGTPFQVAVTLINKEGLPIERNTSGRGRKIRDIKHNITPSRLLKIENNDNYCLFYALELMRIYESMLKKGKMTYMQFKYLKDNQKKRHALVEELLEKTGIPRGLKEYDVETYVPIIQEYWNKIYPGEFKVFIFAEFGLYAPVFKSAVDTYVHPILLYHSEKHFDGIRNINKFFGANKYCLECETTYNKDKDHSLNCKIRCKNCSSVGIQYPCKSDGFKKKCLDCNKEFINAECYHKHLKTFCKNSKLCEKCGAIYSMRDLIKQGRTQHVCEYRLCHKCHKYHPKKSGCYIQELTCKEVEPYRMIFFDFESQQTNQPNPSVKRFLHEVNFAAAITVCRYILFLFIVICIFIYHF